MRKAGGEAYRRHDLHAVTQLGPVIRCREIGVSDLETIADLLTRGFAGRPRSYWIEGLRRHATREMPDGYPRFGYMLEHDRSAVGVLLLIYTGSDDNGETVVRCNLASWYVEPDFRHYAPMLTKIAQGRKDVTYINISPASWTWRTIEALGFRTYCSGLFVSFPALSRPEKGIRIEIVSREAQAIEGLRANEVALLARHAGYGCLSIVCHTCDGRVFPFVLQSMRIRRGWIAPPAMQLIYCRDLADYLACAGAIGRFLLKRCKISVVLDANGRMQGFGFYTEARGRKYFKGPHCPRLADLTDTELVIYGP